VWRFPRVKKKAGHPAPFPVGLPLRCIEASPCSVVLDPFAGLGTTLSAAVAAGVEGVGVEIDERWCEKAARRLEREADLFSTVEA
jgi:site-specific DNA-methyltransferase (adenine-specific)